MGRRISVAFQLAAFVLLVDSWVYLSIARPQVQWVADLSIPPVRNQFFIVVAVCVLSIAAMWRGLNWRQLLIIFLGASLDALVAHYFFKVPAPVYLDVVGSVTVAILLGPSAGAASAALSELLNFPWRPHGVLFAIGNITIAWLAGYFARIGGFSRLSLAATSGFLIGAVSSMVYAPMQILFAASLADEFDPRTFVIGDQVLSNWVGIFQDFTHPSDPLDKALSCVLAYLLVGWLVQRKIVKPFKPIEKPITQ